MNMFACWTAALALAGPAPSAEERATPRLELTGPFATAALGGAAQLGDERGPVPDYRSPECPGCPERHAFRAIWETLAINVGINWFDRATHAEPDQFYTDPKSWWENLKHGFVFDDNNFSTNQFAHPYHGSTYFNAGRANGLGYWESAPLAALGSFTWECCGETHHPSFNDFISTTMGGIAVGEVLHRLGNLVRDNQATGKGRFFKEMGGLLINPITGVNRLTNGDWFEQRENPADRHPDHLGFLLDTGVIFRGEGGSLEDPTTGGFAELEMTYGDPFRTRAQKPFDHFTMYARFGGGNAVSQFNLRGRLFGGHDGDLAARTVFQATQGFTYITNEAYEIGGQSVDAVLGWRRELSPDTTLVASGSLGFIPLGSISVEEENVQVNERTYDMGVGAATGLRATLLRKGFPLAQVGYTLLFVHTVNGSGGEHIAQYIQGRVGLPIYGRIGAGAAAALYLRNSYYDGGALQDTFNKHPEVRAFLTWRLE